MAKTKKKKGAKTELDPRHKLIANRINELRKEAGYTSKEDFSSDHGLGRMSYWRASSGNYAITTKLLFQIIDSHNLTMEQFFSGIKEH